MRVRPITLREANAYVKANHRHSGEVQGQRFSICIADDDGTIHGVGICGNPIARGLQDGLTLEIRRVCTDGTRNACSMLYGACIRIAKDMGYKRVITYTLVSEPGASLRASNFTLADANCGGGTWDTPSRRRGEANYPTEKKQRWEYEIRR